MLILEITGNTSLERQVNCTLQKVKTNDTLFIAFDNKTDKPDNWKKIEFDSGDFIIRTLEKCERFKLKCWTGTCEEIRKDERGLLANIQGYLT